MSTTTVSWVTLCTAAMGTVGSFFAAGEPSGVAEQPDLKQAPVLHPESLGESARRVNVWERWFVPNPDGKSWDVLQVYFKEYPGPTWLCAVMPGRTWLEGSTPPALRPPWVAFSASPGLNNCGESVTSPRFRQSTRTGTGNVTRRLFVITLNTRFFEMSAGQRGPPES